MSGSRVLRSLLLATSAAIVGVATSAAGTGTTPPDPWPMLGGDGAHSGVADGPLPPYRRAWVATFDEDGPAAGPVVPGGVVAVVTQRSVVALDAATGEERWTMPRARGPAGTPAFAGDLILHAEGRRGRAAIVARAIAQGEEVWRVETRAPVAGGISSRYVGARNGVVRAIDLDGDVLWTFEAEGRVDTAPAFAGGRVFIVAENFDNGEAVVYALDEATGREDWRLEPERSRIGVSSVSVAGDTVYVGFGDARFRAVGADTGSEVWSQPTRTIFSSASAPALPGDVVVLDRLGHVYRLDRETGEERWVFRLPGTAAESSPVVLGGYVVVGDETGQVSAIDLDSGELVWKGRVPGGGPIGAPAVAGDLLLVASQGRRGRIVAFEHDPAGTLVREPSPTTLFPARALLNFAAASAALFLLLVGVFRYGLRRRTTDLPGPDVPGGGGKR